DTAAGFTYAWTVTRNSGLYAFGSGASFSFTPDDDGIYEVTLSVSDKDGSTGMDSWTIGVTGVGPTRAVSGPSAGVQGPPRTFTRGAGEPSPVNQAAASRYRVAWADGTPVQSIPATPGNGTGTPLCHVFTEGGTYTVRATAADKDGQGGAEATHTITIT